MAVPKKKCSGCNRSMNAELRRCPNCGKDQKPYLNYLVYIGAIAVVFAFLISNEGDSKVIKKVPTLPAETNNSILSSFSPLTIKTEDFDIFETIAAFLKSPEVVNDTTYLEAGDKIAESLMKNVSLKDAEEETSSILDLFTSKEIVTPVKAATKSVTKASYFETDFTLLSGQTGKAKLGLGISHTWRFNVKKGQFISVGMGKVQGSEIQPSIFLIASDGTKLGNRWGSQGVTINKVVAPIDGEYAIVCYDSGNNNTGEYTVSLGLSNTKVTLSKGDEGGNIRPGTTVTGKLNLGDFDVWTFNAKKGQFLSASMGKQDGSEIQPHIILVGPDGEKLGDRWGSNGAAISNLNAKTSGLYTIFVYDSGMNNSGEYTVSLSVI